MKLWIGLNEAKIRKKEKLLLAEGAKVVNDLLRSNWKTKALLILSGRERHFEFMVSGFPGEVFLLDAAQWSRLSQDKSTEGIMAVAEIPPLPSVNDQKSFKGDRLLLLYKINNPNNLGALLRTAAWFGFSTVLLSNGSVDFTNPKTVRTAMGSLFDLQIISGVDFSSLLPELQRCYRLVAGDVHGSVSPHCCAGKTALLMGSESHGLPEFLLALMNERWRIEGGGVGESLSLPQAAAVMMYACTAPQA